MSNNKKNNLYCVHSKYTTYRSTRKSFVGVGCYVTVTWKITERILFSEISRELNACANSVYQALPPPLERLGTRLIILLHNMHAQMTTPFHLLIIKRTHAIDDHVPMYSLYCVVKLFLLLLQHGFDFKLCLLI